MFPGRSGDYYLFAYNLENRPIGPQRPGAIPTQVVVQPHGTEAHKVSDDVLMLYFRLHVDTARFVQWHFESAGDSKYRITLGHLAATDVDNFVKLMKIPPPPTEWMILPQITAPPSPEPLYK